MVRSVTAVLALAIFPGLTAGQEPQLQAPERATIEEVVRFDFDEATITAEADQLLRAKLPILRNSPTFTLRLEGHADERGSVEYNLALGSRRAESVRNFLTGLGIAEERLTTTSFGEERPLVNRSDQEAWAQNRRVEFVIVGAAGPIVAGVDVTDPAGDPVDDPAGDPANPDLVQTDPAVVGDVTVGPDPAVERMARPVRPGGTSERDRRSRFYRDPTSGVQGEGTEIADYFWVTRTSNRSASWLGPMTLKEVTFDGTIESLVREGIIRTAFPFTVVRLNLEPGFRVRLGDELQIFRPHRVNKGLGVILRPMGVLTVTRVAPNTVEGQVEEVFGPASVGDYVRPAPVFDLRPGEYPAMVTNRTEATVLEFGHVHQLYGLREVVILDQGSDDGVDIGDEYVAFSGDGSTEDVIGRLRVVLTEDETSSARIITVVGPVFQLGTTVYLDRKMR